MCDEKKKILGNRKSILGCVKMKKSVGVVCVTQAGYL